MTWPPYRVIYAPNALRDLERLDRPLAGRVVSAVDRYAETGHGDVKRLQGVEREWRLRVGDWRMRFTLDQTGRVMTVLRVLPRGGAYK